MQVRAANLAGVLQLILAIGVLVEVMRRFAFGSEPESLVMMAIAFVALIANISCLLLISKHREGGAHMKASWIFSANDVVVNMGVITAGALVAWTGSNYPDLIIGTITGVIVLNGARRILALKSSSHSQMHDEPALMASSAAPISFTPCLHDRFAHPLCECNLAAEAQTTACRQAQ